VETLKNNYFTLEKEHEKVLGLNKELQEKVKSLSPIRLPVLKENISSSNLLQSFKNLPEAKMTNTKCVQN